MTDQILCTRRRCSTSSRSTTCARGTRLTTKQYLMADSDETAAAEAAEQQPTQAAANLERENDTQHIHAWSLADDADEPIAVTDRHSWRISAIVTAAAVVLAASTGLGIWKWSQHNDARKATTAPSLTFAIHPSPEP